MAKKKPVTAAPSQYSEGQAITIFYNEEEQYHGFVEKVNGDLIEVLCIYADASPERVVLDVKAGEDITGGTTILRIEAPARVPAHILRGWRFRFEGIPDATAGDSESED